MEPLEIIISAVDDTEGAFASVSEGMESMSAQMDASTASIEDSTSALTMTTQEFADQFFASWNAAEQAVATYSGTMQISIDQVMADMKEFGISAQQASDEIVAANTKISVSSSEMADDSAAANTSYMGGMAALGGVGLLAFNSITSSIQTAITNATQWDQTSATLSNSLKNIGSSIPLSAFQAYAVQVQNLTLFTQNQALQAEAQIASSKQLAPQYEQLTMLAADLTAKAQGAGIANASLTTTTKLLTDALNDPVNGINRLVNQLGTAFPAATVTYLQNMAKAGDTAQSSTDIINALTTAVGGSAEAAANAAGGPLIQLGNQLTALGEDMVQSGLLTDLDKLAQLMIPIIENIAQWTEAHPKLTEALLAGIVVFTALIAILGLVGAAVALLAVGMAGLAVGIAAAVAIIVGIVVYNWGTIEDKTKELWSLMELLFKSGLAGIEIIWSDGWNLVSSIVMDIWNTIGNTVKTGVNFVIEAINAFINALDSLHINIPAITIPGTKLGTPAVDLGFNIPDIPMLAAGGIVYNPTMAMIGEAGPEAVVPLSSYGGGLGGGQPINIYIQGGNYLDKQGASMIAQALATQINRQLKLTSFR